MSSRGRVLTNRGVIEECIRYLESKGYANKVYTIFYNPSIEIFAKYGFDIKEIEEILKEIYAFLEDYERTGIITLELKRRIEKFKNGTIDLLKKENIRKTNTSPPQYVASYDYDQTIKLVTLFFFLFADICQTLYKTTERSLPLLKTLLEYEKLKRLKTNEVTGLWYYSLLIYVLQRTNNELTRNPRYNNYLLQFLQDVDDNIRRLFLDSFKNLVDIVSSIEEVERMPSVHRGGFSGFSPSSASASASLHIRSGIRSGSQGKSRRSRRSRSKRSKRTSNISKIKLKKIR